MDVRCVFMLLCMIGSTYCGVCIIKGKTYKVGKTFVPDSCLGYCQCKGATGLACTSLCPPTRISCSPDEKMVSTQQPVLLNPKCSCEIKQCVPACTLDCSPEEDPYCGTDGITYLNMCFMNKAECQSSGQIKWSYRGPCVSLKTKPKSILKITCLQTNQKCFKWRKEGLCSRADVRKQCCWSCPNMLPRTQAGNTFYAAACISECSPEVDPYCGTDGITYRNLCFMKKAECQSSGETKKNYKGQCVTPKTEPKSILKITCFQTNQKCFKWRKEGLCSREYVKKQCCWSCPNVLPRTQTVLDATACEDDERKSRLGFCRLWKEDGLCVKFKLVMSGYCPRTCGFCA